MPRSETTPEDVADAARWLNLRVVARTQEAEDIVSMVLAAPDGGPLPTFGPGAHIDVEAAPGVIRQYSLCNDPADRRRYEIAILRDPASRGGSIALHDGFAPGATIRASAPRNNFPLRPARGKVLLLAGGIGITPLLPMAQELARSGADFALHHCARAPARTAFIDRISAADFAPHTHWHFDDGPAAQSLDPATILASAGANADIYVCGPAGFIAWICAAATAAGIPQERVHREYFAAIPATPTPGGDAAFRVQLASTGAVIDVAADETAAAALARHGIELPLACEQGICGTCITRVIAGEPDHRDMLMLDGNAEFTPCCSRSHSPVLVLDL